MADAKKCDACGEYFDIEQFDIHDRYENGRPINKITLHTIGIVGEYDICNKCSEKIRKLIGWDKTTLR